MEQAPRGMSHFSQMFAASLVMLPAGIALGRLGVGILITALVYSQKRS
jgi:hypothetical protein